MLSTFRQELEVICGAPLPQQWLLAVAQYPAELRDALRSEDGSDDEGRVGDAELLAAPADILALNREVRSTAIPDPQNRDFLWPERYVVIGESGDGDYYCIDADDPGCGVCQFLHLPVRFKRLTTNFAEFLEMLFEAFLEVDVEEELDEEEEGEDGEEGDGEEGDGEEGDGEEGDGEDPWEDLAN